MLGEDTHRDDWTLAELLDAEREATQDELHTSFPGRVESYDAAAQTADVQPMIRRTLYTEDGEPVREPMPVLRAVPVVQMRATETGWFVHMPIGPGDEVMVWCCERDIQQWRQTGQISDALDGRLHHLQNAVCTPGLPSRRRLLEDLPADAMVIGKVGGATVRIRDDGEVHITDATVRLGSASATKGVARNGDAVQVTIPVGTFLTAATGGVLNASPVVVDGEITSASSTVMAED